MRRTRRKTRGGRISEPSTSGFRFRRPRSRSASPGRIRIIDTLQPHQHEQHEQQEMGPIAHEVYRFKVNCMNGDTHTSPYIYTRMDARTAAREYCSSKGGVNGRIEYDNISRVQ